VIEALGDSSHFDVAVEGDRLVLTPARPESADEVRLELERLELQEGDVTEAVAWARRATEPGT
jgi:hypothetical protein